MFTTTASCHQKKKYFFALQGLFCASATDDKQQTNLAKNRQEAHRRLAGALEGLSNEQSAGAPKAAVCDVTSRVREEGGETPDASLPRTLIALCDLEICSSRQPS